jgi:superfamily II DNA helicase RecQ
MKYSVFSIPIQDGDAAQDELNRFLAAHRVVAIDKEFAADGCRSLWCFCVSYLDGDAPAYTQNKDRIDYREVLSAHDFAVYSRLRALRKELAQRDGIPAYSVFTNEQLADLVRQRAASLADFERINGLGKARIDKYGPEALALLRVALAEADAEAAGGQRDGPDAH